MAEPGKLMFPIGFDFSKTATEGETKLNKILDDLQKITDKKKLSVKLDFGKTGDFSKLTSDIRAVVDEIKKAQEEFAKLSASRPTGGGIGSTTELEKVASQIGLLTFKLSDYIAKLDEVAKKRRTSASAGMSEEEKAAKAAEERARIMALENNTLDNVIAKRKLLNKELSTQVKGTPEYDNTAAQLDKINAIYEQMKREIKEVSTATATEEKKIIKEIEAEEKARQKQWQAIRKTVDILKQEENTLGAISAKIRVYQQYMNKADFGSEGGRKIWEKAYAQVNRLVTAYDKLKISIAEAMSSQLNSINNLNAQLSAYTGRLNSIKIGSNEWKTMALNIRDVSTEIARANQMLADFQAKAFQGLSNNMTKQQVAELQRLRTEIADIDARVNRAYQGALRIGTPDAMKVAMVDINRALDERIRKEEQINKILTSSADLQVKREKEINAIIDQRNAKQAALSRQAQQAVAARKQERSTLLAHEKSIDNINAKLQIQMQRLNSAKFGSDAFNKAIAEVERLTKKLDEAQQRINNLTGKTVSGANQQAQAHRKVGEEMQKQHGYLDRLIRRMAVYASIGAVGGFLTKIREVTAQFELQRVSLGAIIQDQNKANQLFSQIKQFALKSPVKILDLTKYVKQVAAYRIETGKLFDTTKRLADVSVGLGVDMQRIVLAYGQVKAASYLRAAEVRQFTEAGIPLLELLAEKFSEVEGHAVSTEQVMDRISKRGVGFEKVEEIFKDMTDAGGLFYNMQEKQGQTLFGMWAKLGDAASIMYDKIGNTESVNNAMKGTIRLMTDLMRNWKATALAIASLGTAIGGITLFKKIGKVGSNIKDTADAKATAATNARIAAEDRLTAAKERGTIAERKAAQATLDKARKDEMAALKAQQHAQATSKLALGFKSVMASLATGLGIGLVVTAVTALIYEITKAVTKANELKNELNKIKSETTVLQTQSVDNFKRLLNEFNTTVDGSQRQKEVVDELKRSYKEVLPEESLTIENLKKITSGTKEAAEGYKDLTDAIKAYIEEQQHQKQLNTIKEVIGTDIANMQSKLRDALMKDNFMDINEVARFFEAFEKYANDSTKTLKEKFVAAMQEAGIQSAERINKAWDKSINEYSDWYTRLKFLPTPFTDNEQQRISASALKALNDAYNDQAKAIDEVNAKQNVNLQLTIEQQKEIAGMTQWLGHLRDVQDQSIKGTPVGENMINSKWVNQAADNIKAQLAEIKVAWDDSWTELINSSKPEDFVDRMSTIDFDAIIKKIESIPDATFAALKKNKQNMIKSVEGYQKLYNEMVPKDIHVQQIRTKLMQISNTMKDHGKNMQQYLMGINESVDAYLERLNSGLEYQKKLAQQLRASIANYVSTAGLLGFIKKTLLQGELAAVEQTIKGIEELISFTKKYTWDKKDEKKTKEKTERPKKEPKPTVENKSDNQKQNLLEASRLLDEIYKKYKELEKVEGPAKAAEDTKRETELMLKEANKLSGATFDFPFTEDALIKAWDVIIAKLNKLTKSSIKISKDYTDHLNKEIDAYNRGDKATQNQLIRTRPKKYTVTSQKANVDKDVAELIRKQADLELNVLRDYLKQRLKDLSSEIANTKEAKSFYEKILSATGDVDTAVSVTMAIYGETGNMLQAKLAEQISNYFNDINLDVPVGIILEGGKIDYKELEKQVNLMRKTLGEETYQALMKIANDGKKDWTKSYVDYLKDIEKARDYSQKRIELARTTAAEINRIREDEMFKSDDPEEQAKLLAEQQRIIDSVREKAAKEAAKQEWEAFKDTPTYVQMFDDLDYASTTSLRNMKAMLQDLKKVWGENLDPQNLKEMQSRLNEIEEQLARRNPFKGIADGIRKIRDLNKTWGSQENVEKKIAKNTKELAEAKKQLDIVLELEQKPLDIPIQEAMAKFAEAKKKYEELTKAIEREEDRWVEAGEESAGKIGTEFYNTEGVAGGNWAENIENLIKERDMWAQIIKKYKILEGYNGQTLKDVQEWVRSLEEGNEVLGKVNDEYNQGKQEIGEGTVALRDYVDKIVEAIGAIRECIEEWTALGDDEMWQAIWDGFDKFNESAGTAADAAQAFMTQDYFTAITKSITATAQLITAIAKWYWGPKIAKANKEIARQDDILHDLEYTYDRLQKAQEKLFGTEYIQNYRQQLANLEAQAEAYKKQADAERSKGKKADKDAIQGYEDSYKETMDSIQDMADDLKEYLAGTDITSAARDWANSWLEARWSFEDTTEALKENFADMVQNMIVESMAAKLMENILDPVYDAIGKATADNQVTAAEIAEIAELGYTAIGQANIAMEGLMARLQEAGLDLQEMFGEQTDLTGIGRDIATASEESINGLAQGINTQNYYMAMISENVAAMRLMMSGGAEATGADLFTMQNEHLAQLPVIAANTLATAERCERAAIACEEMQSMMERVIDTKGNKHVVNTTMY